MDSITVTIIVALLSSSVVAALINWLKDAGKTKADTSHVTVTTSIALMEKLQDELTRAEERIAHLEDRLKAALTSLEQAQLELKKLKGFHHAD